MRDLLERWSRLQPSRCDMQPEKLGPPIVTLGGYGHYYWGGPASDAVVLAATIEAIEANAHDVREEVGHISHTRARQLLAALVQEGLIASRKVEQGVDVYYDPEAEAEEAA